MATKNLFSGQRSIPKGVKAVDTTNLAGGVAYSLSDEAALAQYALTGCFNGTFYATDEDQMKNTLALAAKCSPEYVAKTAVYAREKGFMKDMPSFLLAYLAAKDSSLMSKSFARIVDSPKMVRNFVQMVRSGQLGRKSLGTAPKKHVTKYLNGLSDDALFRADIGSQGATLQDIIKLVHPRPATLSRAALYGYLLDKEKGKFEDKEFVVAENLVESVREYEAFKKALLAAKTDAEKNALSAPNVPFLMLTALPLTEKHWKEIAQRASWTQIRMNLNTFERQGVFKDQAIVELLAKKLQDPEQIARAKVFPYQLFAAFSYVSDTMPQRLKNALQYAADAAIKNIPKIDGKVYVFPDVSGSMSSGAVTGMRKGATSKIRPIDVAALVAAAVLRNNPEAEVIPFEGDVRPISLNPLDSMMTNAEKLSKIGGGSTNCSAPLALLNKRQAKGDLVIYVSDNESWIDRARTWGSSQATQTMAQWTEFKKRSPKARMVCIDVTPNSTTQAHEREDILNIGGFSDSIFDLLPLFARGDSESKTLVAAIKAIEL